MGFFADHASGHGGVVLFPSDVAAPVVSLAHVEKPFQLVDMIVEGDLFAYGTANVVVVGVGAILAQDGAAPALPR